MPTAPVGKPTCDRPGNGLVSSSWASDPQGDGREKGSRTLSSVKGRWVRLPAQNGSAGGGSPLGPPGCTQLPPMGEWKTDTIWCRFFFVRTCCATLCCDGYIIDHFLNYRRNRFVFNELCNAPINFPQTFPRFLLISLC